MNTCVRRISVSGSEDWPPDWRATIWSGLDSDLMRMPAGGTLIVRHGDADGADTHGSQWVAHRIANPLRDDVTILEEKVPAAWEDCDPNSPACKPIKADGSPHRRPNYNGKRGTGDTYCPAAGHRRNPDVVAHPEHPVYLARLYCLNKSPGTLGTFKTVLAKDVDWDFKGVNRPHLKRQGSSRR